MLEVLETLCGNDCQLDTIIDALESLDDFDSVVLALEKLGANTDVEGCNVWQELRNFTLDFSAPLVVPVFPEEYYSGAAVDPSPDLQYAKDLGQQSVLPACRGISCGAVRLAFVYTWLTANRGVAVFVVVVVVVVVGVASLHNDLLLCERACVRARAGTTALQRPTGRTWIRRGATSPRQAPSASSAQCAATSSNLSQT